MLFIASIVGRREGRHEWSGVAAKSASACLERATLHGFNDLRPREHGIYDLEAQPQRLCPSCRSWGEGGVLGPRQARRYDSIGGGVLGHWYAVHTEESSAWSAVNVFPQGIEGVAGVCSRGQAADGRAVEHRPDRHNIECTRERATTICSKAVTGFSHWMERWVQRLDCSKAPPGYMVSFSCPKSNLKYIVAIGNMLTDGHTL